MVPAVPKRKITHVVQISAQLEQLCEKYSKFNWFLKIACFRYVGPWGQDCVSGVHPCLAHSQNLSELIVHFDGGQNPYQTAVRARTASSTVSEFLHAGPENEVHHFIEDGRGWAWARASFNVL